MRRGNYSEPPRLSFARNILAPFTYSVLIGRTIRSSEESVPAFISSSSCNVFLS